MRNKDANNKPVFILICAAIFIVGGLAGFISIINSNSEDKTLFLVVTAILAVVGIIFAVYGSLRFAKLNKSKKLKNNPNAYVTNATFIKAKISSYSSTKVGAGNIMVPTSMNIYKKIIYEYVDETGVKHVAKSNLSYFPKQVEYLQQKGTFKIKCKGKFSEIIEEIPEVESRFNLK